MKYQVNPQFLDLIDLVKDIESIFENSDIVLQDARNKIKKISYNDTDFVVKSFKKPNLAKQILYTYCRDSKAQRSYQYSLKIAEFVPQAVAFVEFYENRLLSRSYFISEMFDYDLTIREPLIDVLYADRNLIFKAFAQFSLELHQQGILHNDYSPGNILIKKIARQFVFKIIDINRMKFQPLSTRQRMANFSMLWASDDDLDTIVTEYAERASLDKAQCLALARGYNQKNKRIKNFKKRLKGRPVSD